MLLGFKAQFAQAILDGTKTQTIRAVSAKPKAHVPVVGETLYLYTGLRTKQCRHLRDEICRETFLIRLSYNPNCFGKPSWRMEVPYSKKNPNSNGSLYLSEAQCDMLAVRDGFGSASQMMAWFYKEHQELVSMNRQGFPFRVIRWNGHEQKNES